MYLTGINRQLALLRTLAVPGMRRLPLDAMLGVRRFLRDEKLTKLDDGRIVINSFMPPFPSRAFGTLVNGLHALREGRAIPISVYIAVTNRCRYRCWHCSRDHRDGAELGTEAMVRLVADLQDMGLSIIGFTGGEPLLRDDIEEIIASVDERSSSVLFTSGDGLTAERALRLKDAGLFGVAVSLDHYSPEVHDRRRGVEGAFGSAVTAIRNCRERGFYTMIQLVATRDLIEGDAIDRYLELAGSLGVHEIRLLEPMPTGKLLDGDPACCISCEQRETLRWLHTRTNRSQSLTKVCAFAHVEHEERYGCGAGFQHFYIDGSGNVCPCDFVPVSFGNVRDERVSSIFATMSTELGKPRRRCFLMEKATALRELFDGQLPLDWRKVREHCGLRHDGGLPGYYAAMGWQGRTAASPPLPASEGMRFRGRGNVEY
jgi:MoaA/NifB/PqqE/SkfB family radical SAM enzyme